MKNSVLKDRSLVKNVKRGMAAVLAGCLIMGGLAACGEKKDESSVGDNSGVNSTIPLITPAPTPQSLAKAVKVNVEDSLNVRSAASTGGDVLGQVEDGEKLALLSDTPQNGWYNVQYNGGPAYVSEDDVEVIDVTAEQYQQLIASVTATPTPEPDDSQSPDPSGTPDAGSSSAAPGVDNEDGE